MRPFERWERFWLLTGPPDALGMFRIGMGLYWLLRWLVLLPHVELIFSGDGMYFPFRDAPGSWPRDLDSLLGWLTPPMPPWIAWLLYLGTLGCLVLVILGWRTRLALGSYLVLFVYHYLVYLHMQDSSFDRLSLLIGVFLLVSPCGQAFSLDSRRHDEAAGEAPLWAQRLICLQVSLMYLGTGLAKISSTSWANGDLLASTLIGDWATPAAFWWMRLDLSRGWLDLASLGVKLFEICAAFFLFVPRWQRLFFACGFVFHVAIAVFLGLWQFLLMLLPYVLYLPPREVAAWRLQRTRQDLSQKALDRSATAAEAG